MITMAKNYCNNDNSNSNDIDDYVYNETSVNKNSTVAIEILNQLWC